MKQKEICRTATFAWSPASSLPLIATGDATGTVDDSFSNDSRLEIWQPDFMNNQECSLGADPGSKPKGVVKEHSRFSRIAWSQAQKDRPQGVIAATMEDGNLVLWDPEDIVKNSGASQPIFRRSVHTQGVFGLDFNPIDTGKLASTSGSNLYIWDLDDNVEQPSYRVLGTHEPGDLSCISWNLREARILAAGNNAGGSIVFDARAQRQVSSLQYSGGAVGGRTVGMSAIAWNPNQAMQLVTASEDDTYPVILVWDLRTYRQPTKILTGHHEGILSLSWCKQDADLLLSCGKDNRTLCWNPRTSDIVFELSSKSKQAFHLEWCPRNPDLFAAAFLPGTIDIHSIQSAPALNTTGSSLFDDPAFMAPDSGFPSVSLQQPPKWLRRPVTASFGFGGQLVTVSNLPDAQGRHQGLAVHVRLIQTEVGVVERVSRLRKAMEDNTLETFAKGLANGEKDTQLDNMRTRETWKALLSLFRADSRDELMTLLGYSKAEVKARVADAVVRLKETQQQQDRPTESLDQRAHEPVVSFLEPELEGEQETEKTSSEVSASDAPPPDGESTTTAPSLFGDDHIGAPDSDTGADFFSTMAAVSGGCSQSDPLAIPHTSYGLDSSVAATMGSGPSSVAGASETLSLRGNTFRIYPAEESEMDHLVTKALVLGDFESAVELCLSTERYADALLLANKGGQDLLSRTQKAYFARRTTAHPYLRLFQSIVTNDLTDVVQNADLTEWAEIFIVLCAFASEDEFGGLAEQLGARLEFQAGILRAQADEDVTAIAEHALGLRKTAMLTYLAAGRLERLVNIWVEEMAEEEACRVYDRRVLTDSRYGAHAHALQTFVEKVTVFRGAVKFDDLDLSIPTTDNEGAAKTYKLASLYDRYFEYAEMLATQGLVKEAVAYLKLIPPGYTGSAFDFATVRERLLAVSGESAPRYASTIATQKAPVTTASATSARAQTPSQSGGSGQYLPPQPTYRSAQPPHQPEPYRNPYAPPQPPAKPALLSQLPKTHSPASIAAAPRGQNGGWNDAPAVKSDRRTPQATSISKLAAIVSPFPNAASPPTPGSISRQPPNAPLHPPPRPASVQNQPPPPPPPLPPSQTRVPPPPPPQAAIPPSFHARPPTGPSMAMPPPASPPVRPGQFTVPPPHARTSPPPPGMFAPHTTFRAPPVAAHPGPPSLGHTGSTGSYVSLPPGPTSSTGPPRSAPYAPPPPPQAQHMSGPTRPAEMPPPPSVMQHPTGMPPTSLQVRPRAAPPPRGPPPPKYPPGDRTHIPESAGPIYNTLLRQFEHVKQITDPRQMRMIDDLERRINGLFDALNCETLSTPVVEELSKLTEAMEARDRELALAIHVDLLTKDFQIGDMALWMSGIKQLIMRL